MREATRDFLIGLVSIAGLLGLAGLLMRFGELDAVLRPRYVVTVHLDNGTGLRRGSLIELDGVPVGVVDDLDLRDDPARPVTLRAFIDEGRSIPGLVEATVSLSLLGGGSVLQLTSPRTAGEAPPLPTDGTAVIDADRASAMNEIAAALDERMEPVMAALDDFRRLADTYVVVGERMSALVSPQSADDLAEGADPNLYTAVVRLNGAIDEARTAFSLAQEWLDDEQLRADVHTAVTNAQTLIERATGTVDRYTKLADAIEQDADEMVQRLVPVSDEVSKTLEDVRRLVTLARDGDGTVGRMLKDPQLYLSLNDAAVRLEKALSDIQLLIQKLREEGVDIGF